MSKIKIERVRAEPGQYATYRIALDGVQVFTASATNAGGVHDLFHLLEAVVAVSKALGAEVER